MCDGNKEWKFAASSPINLESSRFQWSSVWEGILMGSGKDFCTFSPHAAQLMKISEHSLA